MRKDTVTGLDADAVSAAYQVDPAPRTDPVTPFLDDAHSEGVYRQIVTPNQDYPTRDVRPA